MSSCPCCKRHCLKTDLHCEKGKKYFSTQQLINHDENLYRLLKNLLNPKKNYIILKLKLHKPVSIKKLEKKFNLSYEECIKQIELLEKEEKVYLVKEEKEISVYLTEKGHKEKERLKHQEKVSIFSCLDEQEKQEFTRLLKKMIDFQNTNKHI